MTNLDKNRIIKEEFVYLPEDYQYNSAIDNARGKGILDVELIKNIYEKIYDYKKHMTEK
ncbi:MAG: hypothetical protein ACK5MH_03580 [Bacteroidales bacterium]